MLEIFKDEKKKIIKVKVFIGSSKTKIRKKISENSFEIDLKAKPEQGKANEELIKFISRELEINSGHVKIIKGFKERNKLIKINF
ncbi:DUF167 domain-containing protein [bacterium]|nr:DUF167 domain-containing protein [bacterium]